MKRFLASVLVLFCIPALCLTVLFYTVLARTGELVSPDAFLQLGLSGDFERIEPYFSGGTFSNWFKGTVARQRGADVLVVGTSRSMQFRQEMLYGADFYNAGGAITNLDQLLSYLQGFEEEALPSTLILGLDQYFFNAAWSTCDVPVDWDFSYTEIDVPDALMQAARQYGFAKYSLRTVFGAPEGCYGLSACERQSGFGPDGSYHYGALADDAHFDASFSDTMNRIALRTNRFEYGDEVNPDALALLADVLDFCALHGVTVVAYLPPYAPSVYAAMQENGNYTYLAQLYPALCEVFAAHPGFELYDFTLMPGTVDEEYVDGFHGGDPVYVKMLQAMLGENSCLCAYTDETTLQRLISSANSPRVIESAVLG